MHSHRVFALFLAASLLTIGAGLSACQDGGPDGADSTPPPAAYTLADASESGPHAVGVTTMELVDTSRPTSANGDVPGSAERMITLHVWYPAQSADTDAPVDASGAPYPLLVFAHGFSSLPVFTSTFLRHVASHGYVVAAPEFPLTNLNAPGGPRFIDILNQPGDISFVIDEMLRLNDHPTHRLAAAIDGERVGLAGHSGGGHTANLALYGPDADDRLDAALVISGDRCFLDALGEPRESDAAVMFMTGSEDLLVPAEASRVAYDVASSPRYMVIVRGGNHIRFTGIDLDDATQADRVRSEVGDQLQSEPALADARLDFDKECELEPSAAGEPAISLDRQQELLRAFATPFFDAYLKNDGEALDFLHDGLAKATDGAVEYEFDVD